ncbi:MAG: amidase [Pseudomonadota bacterium]
MTELWQMNIGNLQKALQKRDVSAQEVVTCFLKRIEQHQEMTNAFVSWDADQALKVARKKDAKPSDDPLHGIPIAVKDNYYTIDYPTTACSAVPQDSAPFVDATTVALLRKAGAIIIGKTNMHEWAYGATNLVSCYGRTRNPWNAEHITGGSSGGSGAALAARMVPAALGSDTGGSVRIPSAGCGISGIKPTYGHASRGGILPLSWSFDAPGPMAASAQDLMHLLPAMTGEDPQDPSTIGFRYSRKPNLAPRSFAGLRIGLPTGPGFERDDDVDAAYQNAINLFAQHGAIIQEVFISGMADGFNAWKIILHAEASAYHRDALKTHAHDYSDTMRIQLETGGQLSACDYLKAQQYRNAFNHKLAQTLGLYDTLLLPTLPVCAPHAEQNVVTPSGKELRIQDAMTYVAWIANLSGFPAVSIPCGFGKEGLPVGLMMIGAGGRDYDLLRLAHTYQTYTDWHQRIPSTVLSHNDDR